MEPTKLASRRWWYLMPIVFITYSLAYLDRANYGFAAAAGMAADLHITKELNALIGSLFFLGYFSFQIPGAIYAQNKSVRTLVFWSLILWGGCATLTGIVRDASWLLAIRFLLGVVEAAVLPAMIIFLANWFTRGERSRANTFLILGNPVTILWMSVVSGYVVQALNWRWMFIIEGAPRIIWAGLSCELVLDFAGSYLVGASSFWLSFTLLVIAGGAMYAPYGPFFAMISEMLPKNVAGGATALINSMGALGSFVGSYLVGYLNAATGSPSASYVLMAGAPVVAVVMTLLGRPQAP